MKENYIKKIRTLGKVGNIISIVLDVLVALAIVVTLIGATALVLLPEATFKMGMDTGMVISMDLSDYGVKFTEKEKSEIKDEIMSDEAKVEIAGDEIEDYSVEVTDGGFIFNMKSDMYYFSLKDIGRLLYITVIYQAMTLVTLIMVGVLCRSFAKCESPFDKAVIKKMQILAWSLIPWAILGTGTDMLTEFVMTGKLNFVLNFNLGIVFVILLILVITYIFKYGAMLQQESDETL